MNVYREPAERPGEPRRKWTERAETWLSAVSRKSGEWIDNNRHIVGITAIATILSATIAAMVTVIDEADERDHPCAVDIVHAQVPCITPARHPGDLRHELVSEVQTGPRTARHR